jgi:TRAP-type C4-dicarboxylate transport system substrate-binding protein
MDTNLLLIGAVVTSVRAVVLGLVAGAVTSLLAAGCQSAGITDKTGANIIVLRLATIDSTDPNGQSVAPEAFIRALGRRSGGRIRTTVKETFESGSMTAETDLVKAIAADRVDGGWPSSRAFSRAGIRGLEPIEAPMTLTSYAAQRSLAEGPAARILLSTLDGSGVLGLGLAVGPLRRPWADTQPLIDLRRWSGVTVRSYNSPVQEDTIRALGAVPIPASFHFTGLVRAGTLQAIETDVAQYAHSGYGVLLPKAVGNEVLWPRMMVLSLSQKRFHSLTREQRGWVQGAARDAVHASVAFAYDETTPASHLCSQGVRFVDATPDQLAGLRHAVQPVVDALASDPVTAGSLAQVEKVAALHPVPDALVVPTSCRKP